MQNEDVCTFGEMQYLTLSLTMNYGVSAIGAAVLLHYVFIKDK